MTASVFPDNTVLCNFGAVGRVDLLRDWLRGRGRWCEAVAREAAASASIIPAMANISAQGWLGEPIELDDGAAMDVERIRRVVMGGSPDKPLQHLGEAQTCYLIQSLSEFAGAWWISDDRDALHYARGRGIQTYDTFDIVRMVVADGDLTATQGTALLNEMVAQRRAVRLPSSVRDMQ